MPKSDPYWWEDAGVPASPPQIELPGEVDVLIVGAGLTGLSAARTLARHGTSVLVIDAEAPGIGASSRNGGIMGGGHRVAYKGVTAKYGTALSERLMQETFVDIQAFAKQLMADEEIDCDYAERGRFKGFWRTQEYESAARELVELQKVVPLEAEMVPRERQHEEIASDLYAGGMIYPNSGTLNPAKWVAGILQATIKAGALVQGDTPMTSVTKNGNSWEVVTSRGTVSAAHVLMATNGYTPGSAPELKRRIIPVPSFIVTTEQLGENRIKSLFPNLRSIGESRERHCYYRPSPDLKRIVFGGRAAMYEASESFVESQMRGLLTQIFPELKDVGLTHSWRGRTGFSFEFLPHVGQIDGIWHAMGYSGSGNGVAPYLGHKAALKILGDPEGETAFAETRFPSRWFHQGTAWFLPVVDVAFRAKDVWNNVTKKV